MQLKQYMISFFLVIICFMGHNPWNSQLLEIQDVHLVKQLVNIIERSFCVILDKGPW